MITIRNILFGLALGLPLSVNDMAVAMEPSSDAINSEGEGSRVYDATALPSRLFLPKDYKKENKKASYPMLVFLHGAGERGTENTKQLVHGSRFMARAARDFGCFVLAPQCPPDKLWAGRHWQEKETSLTEKPTRQMQLVLETIDTLCEQYPIDRDRICIMGVSMGGFGVWEAIQRWPEKFAAAVAICGGGDATHVQQIKEHRLPVWVFHGDQDTAVAVERSRAMVDALKKIGATVKYTEYPGVGHNCWNKAFAEPGLLEWITSQRRVKNVPF